MLQTLKTAKGRLGTLVLTPAVWFVATKMAMADNADIRGALETNQQALEAVADSTFTGEGVGEAAQNTTNAILFALGAVGIAMTAWGIWKLYKVTSEGEQSRDSAVGPVLMIVIGGMMTIAAIITAIFPNLFVGEAA
jgi:hypothetical protein